jgi:hypothetical protein
MSRRAANAPVGGDEMSADMKPPQCSPTSGFKRFPGTWRLPSASGLFDDHENLSVRPLH